jgi:hypothetical protein
MDIDTPQQRAVSGALAYLAARNALHKLAEPVPVIGRDVIFCVTAWQTPPPQHDTLPPLERGARI